MKKTKRVLFVCTGNLYRSQAAEAVAKQRFPSVLRSGAWYSRRLQFSSAGVSNASYEKVRVPKKLVEGMGHLGYYISSRKYSRGITAAMLDKADLVVYMQPSHRRYLLQAYLNRSIRDKLVCLASYHVKKKISKIPDLAFIAKGPEFEEVLFLIEHCVMELIHKEKLV